MPYYFFELWHEMHGNPLFGSLCPMCKIRETSLLIIISLLSISLMHNKIMVLKYSWNAKLFYKTLITVFLLYIVFCAVLWFLF
jgi:hypothetical protein